MFVQRKGIRVSTPFKDGNIEVRSRGRKLAFMPLNAMHMADFCLDLVSFKVLKNRYGAHDLSPTEAHEELTRCLNHNDHILLLVD